MSFLIMHHERGDYLTSILFWLGFISPFIGVATAYLQIGDAFTNIMVSLMIMMGLLFTWMTRWFM